MTIPNLSKELNIPMENLLAGIAREEVCALINLTEPGEFLYIIAPDDLGAESYRNTLNRKIKYAFCPGKSHEKSVSQICEEIVNTISGENGNDGISANIRGDGKINLEVRLEKMRVPMKIEIMDMGYTSVEPSKKRITLIRSNEDCEVFLYPTEAKVASEIVQIIKNLELSCDMEIFDKVFYEITSSPMDGKLLWTHLKAGINRLDYELGADGIEIIREYAENKYMQKEWDKYQKRHKLKSHNWKTIIKAIYIFLTPVYEAIATDKPFIGDWMPELGRFL